MPNYSISDNSTLSNQSTDKALILIEALADEPTPIRLKELSKKTGINISTCYRYMTAFEKRGYVYQNAESGQYGLTMKICSLAHKVSANSNISQVAGPFLRSLADFFGTSVCLSIEQNGAVLYIDKYDNANQLLKTFTYIGRIAPMHCTGTGKLFLSNYTDEQLEDFYNTKGLSSVTPNTITSLDQLKKELTKIRVSGYALDEEECELGAFCVAVPIRDYTNKIVAGVSVTGAASYMRNKLSDKKTLDYLLSIGKNLSHKLGYYDSL